MALILKSGAVFLHIPKTGGNWVTAVLRECGLVVGSIGSKHSNLDRLVSPFDGRSGKRLGMMERARASSVLKPKPFMFCFVRHPLSWYESWFKYQTQPACDWRDWGSDKDVLAWHPCCPLNGCRSEDFDGFIRNALEKRPGFVSEMYSEFAKPQVEYVGRQESLRDDLVSVLKRLNLTFDEGFVRDFKEVGVSPVPRQKVEWDPELKQRVLELEHLALLRYGYL